VLRLFYVDESRDRGQRGHHYFVVLRADGDTVARAEATLEKTAEQAWDDGLARFGTELHAAEISNGPRAWQRGSIQERIDLLGATLSVIGDEGVEVIARGANMQRFATRYPGADPYRWEFSKLLERLNERLRTLGDYGLVISDQQTEHREGIQRDVANSKQFGTGGYRSQKLDRILDTAHFVDSKLSRMIRLADIAAFILRRRASHRTEGDARLELVIKQLSRLVYDAIPAPQSKFHTIR